MAYYKWLGLQLFADGAAGDGGAGGDAGAAAAPGVTSTSAPDAGESRLRDLGVPQSILDKRAKRAGRNNGAAAPVTQAPLQQAAAAADPEPNSNPNPNEGSSDPDPAPARMSWDEIMADPEYNKRMQETMQARLKSAKGAEEAMSKMQPALEMLAKKYGLDAANLDAEALSRAIQDDDSYYEDKALELGVSVETAKLIDQNEREAARRQAEDARSMEQQRIRQHIASLAQQGEALKATFPQFDLATELRNPVFARMTSPSGGVSVEDAYYAVHRREIQTASMQVAAQKTAQQMANAIRAGQNRPVENGTSAQAPTSTTFDYSKLSRDQRDAIKRQVREAAARGEKIYPGQMR